MRNIRAVVVLTVLTLPVFAQAPGRVQTPTRFVTIFTNLENQLMDALVANNRAGASRLLADDFAQWTPEPVPTAREDWLKPDRSDMANFQIRQMAVKDLGNHAAAHFILTNGKKAFWVVDIWQKDNLDWQLAERYLTPFDTALLQRSGRPTGKD